MKLDGHETIVKLAGLIFLKRGFAERIIDGGLDAVLDDLGVGDLTDAQRATFAACVSSDELQNIVRLWWFNYTNLRESGEIPPASTSGAWLP